MIISFKTIGTFPTSEILYSYIYTHNYDLCLNENNRQATYSFIYFFEA